MRKMCVENEVNQINTNLIHKKFYVIIIRALSISETNFKI